MSGFVHGRCAVGRKCPDSGVIFKWKGKLAGAVCPTCGLPLKQTAPSLSLAEVREIPPPSVSERVLALRESRILRARRLR